MILPENKTLYGTNFLTKSHNCIRIITLGKFCFYGIPKRVFKPTVPFEFGL